MFREPWEAQAFALAVRLHEAGCFTWRQWTEYLAAEIRAARERGDPDDGTTYYRHWLAALERLVTDRGLLSREELARQRAAWERAAAEAPPGTPIRLEPT